MDLEVKAKELRVNVLDMCIEAETGHVTSSFSCVEILVALYYGILQKDDRLVISKGHCSPLVYTILADLKFIPEKDLETFARPGGKFGVHLQHSVEGVEITAGSLGQGLGIACGMAHVKKLNKEQGTVYCLLGDGECYEGSVWEAAMFAAHHKLDNLVAIVDRNFLCVTDFTEDAVKLEPFSEKWKGFGWECMDVDGHSIDSVLGALKFTHYQKPRVVIAKTIKGKGIPFMERIPLWHGIPPLGEDAERAREALR